MTELKPCPFCGGEARTWNEVHVEPVIDQETGAYFGGHVRRWFLVGCRKEVEDVEKCLEGEKEIEDE